MKTHPPDNPGSATPRGRASNTRSEPPRMGRITVRRMGLSEHGPRRYTPFAIDYKKLSQEFPCLYIAVTQVIADCGPCCRADLAFIPALSRYTPFQLERALLTAAHHGLLRRVGTIPSHHPDAPSTDDPDNEVPGIYAIDPLGAIDRDDTDSTITRALATRSVLEQSWTNGPAIPSAPQATRADKAPTATRRVTASLR